MTFLLTLLAIIFVLYKLLVDGWLWKTYAFFATWIGTYLLLKLFTVWGSETPMTIGGSPISWAVIIPTIICVMLLATTKVQA
jgi:hypothetical protein